MSLAILYRAPPRMTMPLSPVWDNSRTYTRTWGTGVDTFTLQIGPVGVRDGESTLGLLLVALRGLFA